MEYRYLTQILLSKKEQRLERVFASELKKLVKEGSYDYEIGRYKDFISERWGKIKDSAVLDNEDFEVEKEILLFCYDISCKPGFVKAFSYSQDNILRIEY